MEGPSELKPRRQCMALKELERLTGELADLAQLLRAETRPLARTMILARVDEIMKQIGRDE
jgi:hypothetical protein